MYHIGKTYLITMDAWFTAPNGMRYNCVFGTVRSIINAADQLGITVNSRSMNFYINIGNLSIAGCQVHYAVECERIDTNLGGVYDFTIKDGEIICYIRDSYIYDADQYTTQSARSE